MQLRASTRRIVPSALLLLSVLLFSSGRAFAAEDRVALVIGNGAYQHVAALANPPNDARLTAETLKSLGFKVIGNGALINADHAGMEKAIRDFGKALKGGAIGLFYYAGHGVQISGENYLVPVTADIKDPSDVKYELMDVDFVLDEMKNAGNRLNIVILDACRNNPFGGRGFRAVTGGLAQMQAPEGTLISYATQPGNVAGDGDGRDSPFTVALTAAMVKPGLSLFETFNDVGLAVKASTGGQQQPWLASSPIEGSFQFRAGNPAATPHAPAASDTASSISAADDRAFWESVKDSKDSAEFKAYLNRFPRGIYAPLASARIDSLKASAASARATSATVPAAPGKLTPGGPYPGWATSSLLPGIVGTGTVVINADGSVDAVDSAGDRGHAILNLSDPNHVVGTETVQLAVRGGVQGRYPDGSTSAQVTIQGHFAGGKISGTYRDKFQTGQFEWTVAP